MIASLKKAALLLLLLLVLASGVALWLQNALQAFGIVLVELDLPRLLRDGEVCHFDEHRRHVGAHQHPERPWLDHPAQVGDGRFLVRRLVVLNLLLKVGAAERMDLRPPPLSRQQLGRLGEYLRVRGDELADAAGAHHVVAEAQVAGRLITDVENDLAALNVLARHFHAL